MGAKPAPVPQMGLLLPGDGAELFRKPPAHRSPIPARKDKKIIQVLLRREQVDPENHSREPHPIGAWPLPLRPPHLLVEINEDHTMR